MRKRNPSWPLRHAMGFARAQPSYELIRPRYRIREFSPRLH
jgi:hypothetical protein